jgi:hypothetical protein
MGYAVIRKRAGFREGMGESLADEQQGGTPDARVTGGWERAGGGWPQVEERRQKGACSQSESLDIAEGQEPERILVSGDCRDPWCTAGHGEIEDQPRHWATSKPAVGASAADATVNTHEAKSILARYRPGTADDLDPWQMVGGSNRFASRSASRISATPGPGGVAGADCGMGGGEGRVG